MGGRKSGILLHITSLPGEEGIGTLGKNAYRFVDFLAETQQKIWQILPLGHTGCGNSPYQSYSAFAGNILLIDLKILTEEGLLNDSELKSKPRFKKQKVDFNKILKWKFPLLLEAFKNFRRKSQYEYQIFLKEQNWWLKDYALFMAAKNHFNGEKWTSWPDELKYRKAVAIHKYQEKLEYEIEFWKFIQFQFFKQWFALKKYANDRGINITGDMPIYVSTESVDVWANADIFILDKKLHPKEFAGVPPDYFSDDGQFWGNPVFNWKRLEERDFDWWIARLHFNLYMFDQVRIDHFRGLESYWSIPAKDESAKNGKWVAAKGYKVLEKLKSQIGHIPLIAEDLGIITQEVKKLRDDFELPGMKVLQFAFLTDASNEYLPHNYKSNFVAYTGTHDNNTTLGWLKSTKAEERKKIQQYLGGTGKKALQNAINYVCSSIADTVIIPMQDILNLSSRARMNTPGVPNGNWEWRFHWRQLKKGQKQFLKSITEKYNR